MRPSRSSTPAAIRRPSRLTSDVRQRTTRGCPSWPPSSSAFYWATGSGIRPTSGQDGRGRTMTRVGFFIFVAAVPGLLLFVALFDWYMTLLRKAPLGHHLQVFILAHPWLASVLAV